MIELRSVVKTYSTADRAKEFRALDGISTRFEKGKITVILGPSGSGKSTLLRLLNRMIEPDSGEVLIDGKTALSIDPVSLRRRTGYVIQNIGLFPHMSVAGNISVIPNLLGWSKDRTRARITELLDLVHLPQTFAERRPHQLSGGEAQRVGVARALAANPEVLLMDEPFGALDALTRENIQNEFIRIQKELQKTVVFVTHDVGESVRLADSILVMKEGRIAGSGNLAQLSRNFRGTFVQDFLGTRFEIELLSRTSASSRADFSLDGTKNISLLADRVPLHDGATLSDALAMMMVTESTEIAVMNVEGKIGRLSLEKIVRENTLSQGK